MPALSFKGRFSPRVEDGTKPHTIRKPRARRPIVVGDKLFLYNEQRNPKTSRLLFITKCTKIVPCIITVRAVRLGETWLDADELEAFAKSDGFEDSKDFFDYWKAEGVDAGTPARMVVIYWNYDQKLER